MVVRSLSLTQAENATTELIKKITDSDSDVAAAAKKALDGRSFTDKHITQFGLLLNHSLWQTRVVGANFLSTAKGNSQAIELLYNRLLVESDRDVQNAIKNALIKIKI